jgi:Asparaginase
MREHAQVSPRQATPAYRSAANEEFMERKYTVISRRSVAARAVMEKSEDVFLIGEGAERFAREHGISFEDAEYLLTEARIAQLAEAKNKQAIVLDHSQANERKLGTVGAVARVRSSSECFAAVAVAGALWRASASGGANPLPPDIQRQKSRTLDPTSCAAKE